MEEGPLVRPLGELTSDDVAQVGGKNASLGEMLRKLGDVGVRVPGGIPVGICGQAPSDYPEFAAFLVEAGIDTISLNPDSVVEVIERLSR